MWNTLVRRFTKSREVPVLDLGMPICMVIFPGNSVVSSCHHWLVLTKRRNRKVSVSAVIYNYNQNKKNWVGKKHAIVILSIKEFILDDIYK
jgi:hypothetical protein